MSIIKLPKYHDSRLKYLPIILGYTFFNELLGGFILYNDNFALILEEGFSNYNHAIYNIYDVIFFPFFFYVYWHELSKTFFKKLIKYGALVFFVGIVVNSFIVNPLKYELLYAYLIGSFLLILSTIAYLGSIDFGTKQNDFSRNLLFWLSLGVLIFHLGYAPISIFKNQNIDISVQDYANVRKIHIALIYVMYGSFLIGFLRMKRIKPA